MGTFPRFVRKNLCQLVIEHLKFPETTVMLRKNYEFPYEDKDFKIKLLTDKDVGFMKSLLLDSFDWVIVDSRPGLNTFWCNKDYMSKVKSYTLPCVVRFEVVLPYSMQRCAATILSTLDREKVEEITTKVSVREEFDHETCKKMIDEEGLEFSTKFGKRSCFTAEWDFLLPFPFTTPRKDISSYSLDYDASTSTLLQVQRVIISSESNEKRMAKVFTSKTGKEVEKKCYFSVSIGAHHLQKIDDHKTLYKQTHLFNPLGFAHNKTLQRMVTKVVGQGVQKTVLEHVPKKNCETWDEVIENLKGDPISKMIQELDIPKRDKEYNDSLKREDKFEEKIEIIVEN